MLSRFVNMPVSLATLATVAACVRQPHVSATPLSFVDERGTVTQGDSFVLFGANEGVPARQWGIVAGQYQPVTTQRLYADFCRTMGAESIDANFTAWEGGLIQQVATQIDSVKIGSRNFVVMASMIQINDAMHALGNYVYLAGEDGEIVPVMGDISATMVHRGEVDTKMSTLSTNWRTRAADSVAALANQLNTLANVPVNSHESVFAALVRMGASPRVVSGVYYAYDELYRSEQGLYTLADLLIDVIRQGAGYTVRGDSTHESDYASAMNRVNTMSGASKGAAILEAVLKKAAEGKAESIAKPLKGKEMDAVSKLWDRIQRNAPSAKRGEVSTKKVAAF